MDKNFKFICTTSKETADKLITAGYMLLNSNENDKWTFLNKGKMTFTAKDNVVYTNKLFI